MNVKATREGLTGRTTASGYVIEKHMPFVALPCTEALYRFLRVANPANGKSAIAIVLDVGPWNTDDWNYVMNGARPQSETGKDTRGRLTNGSGIDLSENIWAQLGMTDNSPVEWEFLA